MKKRIITLFALALTTIAMYAGPVGQETAQRLTQAFVSANFEFTRQSTDLNLVYTALSHRGEACYYVFNVGDSGFVIFAADDHYRPVIGYSAEGTFDPDDMAPALAYHLENICQGVMEASMASSAKPAVAADWAMLEKTGRMVSRHGGREDVYLVQTKWNQNYPYNYFCPTASSGSGGRCYAGCVATAAAQVMRYWNHPAQGNGSYCYTHSTYGQLCADFGSTTYDWTNMPNTINSNSSMSRIEAIARLQYHVGVSVDMNYSPSGSGAVTGKLCQTMPTYFGYTNQMDNLYRSDYTHDEYMQLVINAVDMGWPMAHRGGGHAYVLDGYNDYDQVHFNWGWSGSGDGWFNVDEHNYADDESVIYNYVPADVYAATPAAPTDFLVAPADGDRLAATLSWINPTVSLTNEALPSIDQIVITRYGQVIHTEENVTPGDAMTFVDETVPYYDIYDYAIYAVTDGRRGVSAFANNVLVLPSCNWKIVMKSNAFQGWNGGYVSLYSLNGKEIQRMTITSSVPATLEFAVPIGRCSLAWTAPNYNVSDMTVIVRDSENNIMFTYSGPSTGLHEGTILLINNGCGNNVLPDAPYDLRAESSEGHSALYWETDTDPIYGFNLYRDEQLYALIHDGSARSYIDEDLSDGHCYTIRALDTGGESDESNETCASAGDCLSATNFDFEYVGDTYKIKLLWDKPEPSDGLTGYYLFRKDGEDGTYQRIKLVSANSTSCQDNTANVQGDYYYRLYAYYRATDCTSAPASTRQDPNKFHLKVYYSPTDVAENETSTLKLYPNPARQSLCIEADDMNHVAVYDLLGQMVYHQDSESDMMTINVSDWTDGVYLVKVQTSNGQQIRRVSVIH